jgi:hypothetical protein
VQQCDAFAGLQASVNRYELLLLVKKVGPSVGFSPRAIQLLDFYMAYTTDQDWSEGSRVIVYQAVAKTALAMGVTERQIQKLERQLFELGALTWRDSGNHRRYGQRDKQTGKLLYGYGVDLTPLAYLKESLENKLHEKQLHDQAWLETKRQISWHRGQVRGLLLELGSGEGSSTAEFAARHQALAVKIRTHHSLATLRDLLKAHQTLRNDLIEAVEQGEGTASSSSQDAKKFVPIKTTTQPSFDKSKVMSPAGVGYQEDAAGTTAPNFKRGRDVESAKTGGGEPDDPILATGLQHLSLKDVLGVASSQIWDGLPTGPRPVNWNDLVEAAYRRRSELGISQPSWGEACRLLGRAGAAVCVLITDRATTRNEDPVREPASYFQGMLRKFPTGELRLHRSVLGLLEPAGLGTWGGCSGGAVPTTASIPTYAGSLC